MRRIVYCVVINETVNKALIHWEIYNDYLKLYVIVMNECFCVFFFYWIVTYKHALFEVSLDSNLIMPLLINIYFNHN